MGGAITQPKSFKVGEAPWEVNQAPMPKSFKVGEAPWEIEEKKGFLDEGITPRKIIKGALSTLPTIGQIGGGILGGAAGFLEPVPGGTILGTIGGAGLGGMAGESLKKTGETYLLGEEAPTREQYLKDVAKEGLIGLTAEAGGQVLGAGIKAASPFVKKTASTLSGIPEKAISTFKKAPQAVEALFKEFEGNLPLMSDKVKTEAMNAVKQTKKVLNGQIEGALKTSKQMVDTRPIRDEMLAIRKQLDPKVPSDLQQIEEINVLLSNLEDAAEQIGEKQLIPIQTANRFKRSWQDQASYDKAGELFNLGNDTARAAKAGAAKLNEQISTLEPAIREANTTLSRLHQIDEALHANILGVEKPEAGLLAAGSGANQRNYNLLKELGEITKSDMLQNAENLSAARYFGNPSFLPEGPQTGAMLARQGLGGKIGGIAGGALGGLLTGNAIGGGAGYYLGKELGGFASSPAAVKLGIKGVNAIENLPPQLMRALRSGANRGLIKQYLDEGKNQ